MSELLITGAKVLSPPGKGPVRGSLEPEALAGNRSVFVRDSRFTSAVDHDPETEVDGSGCLLVPGLVDAHTHLYVAAGSDVRVTLRSFSEVALTKGTTAVEVKVSADETHVLLGGLRAVKECAAELPQRVTVSLYAGDTVPEGKSQGEWVGELANDVLPVVAEEELARGVDLRVEIPALALEHAARLAAAAEPLGLEMDIHADQLADNQTASFAARWNFRSASHLNHTSPEGVADLVSSDTAAVLLPTATARLRQARKPFARELVRNGAIVALGSDHGPATPDVPSMLDAMSLARVLYGLGAADALAAVTANGAWALGLSGELGRIEPGLRADALLLQGGSLEDLKGEPVVAVICGGDVAYVHPGEERRISREA